MENEQINEPEDLGLKIASKEDAIFNRTLENAKNRVIESELELDINKVVLEHLKAKELKRSH